MTTAIDVPVSGSLIDGVVEASPPTIPSPVEATNLWTAQELASLAHPRTGEPITLTWAWALLYVSIGWKVLRLYGVHPNKAGTLVCDCIKKSKCKKPGKHPRMGDGWNTQAAMTFGIIDQLFRQYPNSNVGLAPYGDFGVVIDLDVRKPDVVDPETRIATRQRDGREVWAELQEIDGEAPATLTSTTGSGGKHLIFRVPDGYPAPGNSLPALKNLGLSGVIDVRGFGKGQIVAPPSLHAVTGNRYRWLDFEAPIADLPTWLYTPSVPTSTLQKVSKRTNAKTTPVLTRGSSEAETSVSGRTTVNRDADLFYQAALQRYRESIEPDAELRLPTLRLIESGDTQDDRSLTVWKICKGAAGVNFDVAKLYVELMNPINVGGAGLRERVAFDGEDRGIAWIREMVIDAHREIVLQIEELPALEAEAQQCEFPKWIRYTGRNTEKQKVHGAKAKEVLLASFYIAREQTSTRPMLGTQQLAGKLNMGPDTVRKAFQALEEVGWWVASEKPNLDGKNYKNAYLYAYLPSTYRNSGGAAGSLL